MRSSSTAQKTDEFQSRGRAAARRLISWVSLRTLFFMASPLRERAASAFARK
jgi:hypothetical protein